MGMSDGPAGSDQPSQQPPERGAAGPEPAGQPSSGGAAPTRVPDVPARAVRPLYTRPAYVLLIVFGGGVGTMLRYLAEEARPTPAGGWPWTTFGINVLGSFILGTLLTALARSGPDQGWRRRARLGMGTGFCGGFTTYSTFVIELDTLLRGGWAAMAIGYALASVVVGITAALAGVLAVRALPLRSPAVAA